MVAHGTALTLEAVWAELDPSSEPRVAWVYPVNGPRAVVLLGAFDPPTRAHVALVEAGAKAEGIPGVLCFTKELLARSPDELLTAEQRLSLLDKVARTRAYGLAVANRGTYRDVHRAMGASGVVATFLIGSDKLAQLRDPSFYPDGQRGVLETFADVKFLVMPRAGADVDADYQPVLQPLDDALASLSSTEVRRRLREGSSVADLVPAEVAVDLGDILQPNDG